MRWFEFRARWACLGGVERARDMGLDLCDGWDDLMGDEAVANDDGVWCLLSWCRCRCGQVAGAVRFGYSVPLARALAGP